jgi:hypothetical protein
VALSAAEGPDKYESRFGIQFETEKKIRNCDNSEKRFVHTLPGDAPLDFPATIATPVHFWIIVFQRCFVELFQSKPGHEICPQSSIRQGKKEITS